MKHILIVDDEPDIAAALEIILGNEGFKVTTRSTTSVPEVKKLKPDLVILDLLLVGTNGHDICKYLKNDPLTKNIPVVLFSAHPPSRLKVLAKSSGANGYLQKPFDLETLLKIIQPFLT